MTGFFASRTGPGTSSKRCRNHFGTPPTGRSFTCSKNQSRHLPTRFPKGPAARCVPDPSSIGRSDYLVHRHRESGRAGRDRCSVRQGRHLKRRQRSRSRIRKPTADGKRQRHSRDARDPGVQARRRPAQTSAAARDSRWRMCCPLEASIGAVPVQDAKRLRLGNRATSPTSARILAAPAGPMPWRSISRDPLASTAAFSSDFMTLSPPSRRSTPANYSSPSQAS